MELNHISRGFGGRRSTDELHSLDGTDVEIRTRSRRFTVDALIAIEYRLRKLVAVR